MQTLLPTGLYRLILFLSLFAISCNDNTEKTEKKKVDQPALVVKKDSTVKETKQAPVINISDTIAVRYKVITIKDSASTSLRLSQKLAQIYGVKLADVIKKNKLTVTGPPIAWYKSQKPPFFFEAGLPVDKKPAKLDKKVLYKEIGGDSAVVARYYGPYEQSSVAYEALEEWMTDYHKKLSHPPYELYVDDPLEKDGKPKDPYKVMTKIVFPRK